MTKKENPNQLERSEAAECMCFPEFETSLEIPQSEIA
jgi:hypothetical protein